MFKKILLPLDLTDRHHPAIATAANLARSSRGELVLLHVIEIIPGLGVEEERDFYARLEKRARLHFGRLTESLKKQNIPWQEAILFGNRVAVIVQYARENGVDLIVLTSPRFDPNQLSTGWGSLSYKVGILAPCPVLLVK